VGIRVARGTVTRICDHGENFALQILHATPLQAAMAAARLARSDLLALAHPAGGGDAAGAPAGSGPIISQVVAAPGGPLLVVEHLDASYDVLRAVPDLVEARLVESGVTDALIVSPDSAGTLERLEATPNAVVLRLFPEPAGAAGVIPPEWLDVAGEWVLGDLSDDDHVRIRILSIEYEVSVSEAAAVLHECGLTRAWCDMLSGSLADRMRTASLTFGRLPHVALAGGGPGTDRNGLLARFGVLHDVARDLAGQVAYACIDFEPTFEGLALGLSPDGWRRQGGAPPNLVAGELVDELVPDAYPLQILGPLHAQRLANMRDLVPLRDGRFELAIGHPPDWLQQAPTRLELQASGWELLRPCLADEEGAYELLRARPRPDEGGTPSGPGGEVLPDLDAIVVEAQPHSRRGTRLTILELASWIGHEPHSDSPACVSPVLSTFLRWWTSGLDPASLQRCKFRAVAIASAAGSPADDAARRWAATDWLARVHAPAWLRLAGLVEAADRLESLGPVTGILELVRAVDILGSAITIASRRIDVTAAIASGDPLAEQLAWEAWEDVSEQCAWVAASETATEGAPADLTYATDLRIIECSRDPRAREDIENAHVAVGDTAWSTALHAVADEAWEKGWRAADEASTELSGLGLRDQMNRIAAAIGGDTDADADLQEYELEAAADAGRDELTSAALRGGALDDEGVHPWDAARQAARTSAGGATWTVLLEEARRTIGEDAWAQSMADARAASDSVLKDAPDLVARVVTAAVAREAASAAARGVAYRSIAIARSAGADQAHAQEAARNALAGTAAALRNAAFDLLERLIDPHAGRGPAPAPTTTHLPVDLDPRPVDLSKLKLS
jgi:hypothetical protein